MPYAACVKPHLSQTENLITVETPPAYTIFELNIPDTDFDKCDLGWLADDEADDGDDGDAT